MNRMLLRIAERLKESQNVFNGYGVYWRCLVGACPKYSLNPTGAQSHSTPPIAESPPHAYPPPSMRAGICRGATSGWAGERGEAPLDEHTRIPSCLVRSPVRSPITSRYIRI